MVTWLSDALCFFGFASTPSNLLRTNLFFLRRSILLYNVSLRLAICHHSSHVEYVALGNLKGGAVLLNNGYSKTGRRERNENNLSSNTDRCGKTIPRQYTSRRPQGSSRAPPPLPPPFSPRSLHLLLESFHPHQTAICVRHVRKSVGEAVRTWHDDR